MSDPGTMALECGGRVDFGRLRRERLARSLAEMERDGLDALLLGREANARYVSGARRLWTCGLRPFAPGCVVLREGAQVHLLSTWDEGIPPEIPRERLFQTTWNPRNLLAHLGRIDALKRARRIGVDGMTPAFAQALHTAFPDAEFADGSATLLRARSRKTPDELECIRTAVAIAEGALVEVARHVRPGVGERTLRGLFAEAAARQGTPIQALEASFCATPTEREGDDTAPPLRQLVTERPLEEGDLVLCHGGVLYAGYEGGVGRPLLCAGGDPLRSAAQRDRVARLEALMESLRAACQPGAEAAELYRAYERSGEPLPRLPVLHGVGLGVEPPIAGPNGDPAGARLEAGMVVSIQGYVWREGLGGCFGRETLHITARGPELLDRLGYRFQSAPPRLPTELT